MQRPRICFTPVPLKARHDGWTPARQRHFIHVLAVTKSITRACKAVGMSAVTAYALRKRPGAAGFAAAWDAALGKPHAPVDLASAKSTGLPADYRFRTGLLQVIMYAGRYATTRCKDDNNALLQHLAQLDRATRGLDL